jgi:hypothetical protein
MSTNTYTWELVWVVEDGSGKTILDPSLETALLALNRLDGVSCTDFALTHCSGSPALYINAGGSLGYVIQYAEKQNRYIAIDESVENDIKKFNNYGIEVSLPSNQFVDKETASMILEHFVKKHEMFENQKWLKSASGPNSKSTE